MEYLEEAFGFLRKKDKRFEIILDELPELQYDIPDSLYVELLGSIVSQQLSTKVARVIWARFLALFPDGSPTTIAVLKLDTETLRSVGLSNAKAQYILNVAEYFHRTENKDKNWYLLNDEELLKDLTSIKGVGVWTVQMLQIFSLYKTDIWPVGDLGVRQGFATLYGLDSPDKELIKYMGQHGDRFKPFRSAVALILWKWKDIGYPGLDKVNQINKKRK